MNVQIAQIHNDTFGQYFSGKALDILSDWVYNMGTG
jgi:hypothetical protein